MTERFFDEATIRFLAEEANGGICSIAVNNILIEVQELESRPRILERCNPETGIFTPVLEPSVERRWWRRDTPEQQGGFRALSSQQLQLNNGLSVAIGMHRNVLGAVTEEDLFIPLVEFFDRRNEDNCSFAILTWAPTDLEGKLVVTYKDEERVVLAQKELRGNVLTKHLLDTITNLIELKKTGGDQTALLDDLSEYLDIDRVVGDALNLELGVDYKSEQELRARLKRRILNRFNSLEGFVVHESHHDSPSGAATDSITRTEFWPRGEQALGVLTQTIEFPEAMHDEPIELFRIKLGKRIGETMLLNCLDESKTPHDVIRHVYQLSIKRQEELRKKARSIRITHGSDNFVHAVELADEMLEGIYDIEKVENEIEQTNSGLEKSTIWAYLEKEEKHRAFIAVQQICKQFADKNISAEDFRIVRLDEDEARSFVVYAGVIPILFPNLSDLFQAATSEFSIVMPLPGTTDNQLHTVDTRADMTKEVYEALYRELEATGSADNSHDYDEAHNDMLDTHIYEAGGVMLTGESGKLVGYKGKISRYIIHMSSLDSEERQLRPGFRPVVQI